MTKPNFDVQRGHDLLMQWKDTGECPEELCKMYYVLLERLLTKASYVHYPDYVKEDMTSEAVWQFLKYSHNYNPKKIKSKQGSFTFLTFNAEMSFKTVLKKYYKHKNISQICTDTIEMAECLGLMQEDIEEGELDSKK